MVLDAAEVGTLLYIYIAH